MKLPATPEGRIAWARKIDEFLKDDAIATITSQMERMFYEEFIAADTGERRTQAWAKAKALREFEQQMRAVLSAGEREMLELAKAAKKEQDKRK